MLLLFNELLLVPTITISICSLRVYKVCLSRNYIFREVKFKINQPLFFYQNFRTFLASLERLQKVQKTNWVNFSEISLANTWSLVKIFKLFNKSNPAF